MYAVLYRLSPNSCVLSRMAKTVLAILSALGSLTFCGFPGYKPVLPDWFKICVGFITGTPKVSPKVVL